jgi:hypothetical protein
MNIGIDPTVEMIPTRPNLQSVQLFPRGQMVPEDIWVIEHPANEYHDH